MTQQQTTTAQRKKTVARKVISFGCRLNHAESEQIEELLRLAKPEKETIVINSCSVTNEAERRLHQKIRQIHRRQPRTQIILTGCAAQTNQQFYRNMPSIAKVIGNDKKLLQTSYSNKSIDATIDAGQNCGGQDCGDDARNDATTELRAPSIKRGSNTRFILPVQQGCDHRCTFCIIPYARGKSRSLSIDATWRSVKRAVDNLSLIHI